MESWPTQPSVKTVYPWHFYWYETLKIKGKKSTSHTSIVRKCYYFTQFSHKSHIQQFGLWGVLLINRVDRISNSTDSVQIHPLMFKMKRPDGSKALGWPCSLRSRQKTIILLLFCWTIRGFRGDSYSQTSRCGAGTLLEGLEHGINSTMELPFFPSPLFSNLRLCDFSLRLWIQFSPSQVPSYWSIMALNKNIWSLKEKSRNLFKSQQMNQD